MALKDLSVPQVQELMEEHFEYVQDNWKVDVDGIESWHELKWGATAEIPGLGKVVRVDDYGGEGQGNDYWVAFSVTQGDVTRHFRMDGYYSSYGDGGVFENDLKEVWPKQKTITVWETR
jgi:hypothetical protein